MVNTGKLINIGGEPMLHTNDGLLRICKGSQVALEATGRNLEGIVFEYELLASNQAVILNFHT
jgi:hypothetical protein